MSENEKQELVEFRRNYYITARSLNKLSVSSYKSGWKCSNLGQPGTFDIKILRDSLLSDVVGTMIFHYFFLACKFLKFYFDWVKLS